MDSSKVQALKEMDLPQNPKELKRLLGLSNFLAKFVPNYSMLMAPLLQLSRKDIIWEWLPLHDQVLMKLKQLLATAAVLAIFDPIRETILATDASNSGLGAVLMQ